MSALLLRVIVAVICVVAIFTLLPPLFRTLGIEASGDMVTIIKVCVGFLALLYVVKGPPISFPS